MYAPGVSPPPHASQAPMSSLCMLGAVQVKPSPCHAKVPTVAGSVEKYVERYVKFSGFVVLTNWIVLILKFLDIKRRRQTNEIKDSTGWELLLELAIV